MDVVGEHTANRIRLHFADRRADAASSSSTVAEGRVSGVLPRMAVPSGAERTRPCEENSEQEQAKRRCIEKPDTERARAMPRKSPSMSGFWTCVVKNGEWNTPATVNQQCAVVAN